MPEIEDLVNYAIIIAVTVVVILFITGRFIDLSVERQTSTQNRATINLLQMIVTDAPFLMEDSAGNKLKLMIDESEYLKSGKRALEDCCDSIQYDYRFFVAKYSGEAKSGGTVAIPTGPDIQSGNPTGFDEKSPCYFEFALGSRFTANVPVNICSTGNLNTCEQGTAFIETVTSPLSEMTYWISQACESEFDLSKRIPLSVNDYIKGSDIVLDKENNRVCFKDECKKFSCGKDVSERVDSTLLGPDGEGETSSALEFTFACKFARVTSEGGNVFLYDGLEDKEIDVPEGATDIPKDHDAWTEDSTLHFSVKDPNYEFSNDNQILRNVKAEAGDNYILFMNKRRFMESIKDQPLYLDVGNVEEELDDCGGNKCVKMIERGLEKIKYQARVYPAHTEGTKGVLTWKLYDSEDRCIETNTEKDEITHEWKDFEIVRPSSQSDEHKSCSDSNSGEFNWEITRVEWNTCEPRFFGYCVFVDEITALAIDNFYFEVAK